MFLYKKNDLTLSFEYHLAFLFYFFLIYIILFYFIIIIIYYYNIRYIKKL